MAQKKLAKLGQVATGGGYRATVTYVQPTIEDLVNAFIRVVDGYRGVEFKPIDTCKQVSTETREIEFLLIRMDDGAGTDRVLSELEKHDLRPALYEEFCAFLTRYQELPEQLPIVALGSVCRHAGARYSPCVTREVNGRGLELVLIYKGRGNCHFLAVRKQP